MTSRLVHWDKDMRGNAVCDADPFGQLTISSDVALVTCLPCKRAGAWIFYWECMNGIPFCRHCDTCGYPVPCGRCDAYYS